MTGNNSLEPNTTALAVLKVIVDTNGTNMYGISKKLKVPGSKISYHLPSLVEAGLIVHDEETGVYVPQPILTDAEFIEVVDKAIDTIYEKAAVVPDKVYAASGKVQDVEAILENCVRARIQLSLC